MKIIDKHLDLLSHLSNLMEHVDDADVFIQKVVDTVRESGFEYTSIKLLQPIHDELNVAYSSGLSEDQEKLFSYKLGEGITGEVASLGQEISLYNTDKDGRFLDKLKLATGASYSFYCFPIKLESSVVGVINSLGNQGSPEIHQANILFFRTLSPLIAQSLRITSKFNFISKQFLQENQRLQKALSGQKGLPNIIGKGSKMNNIYDQILNVAPTNASVLITGANGTGKEMIADALHYQSHRAEFPFIKVNCAALPENLLESELFGHEKGAFTGAIHQKKGRFELAQGGTIFLDEIGELPFSLQSKLLRVLQNREYERVGGTKTLRTDARVIVASNKNLNQEVELGNFREDLFYRLNVYPIYIPKLSERKTDILLLAEHFLKKYTTENKKSISRISTPAIDLIMSYHWPGNVRELENCIERAVIVAEIDTIRSQDLPPSLQSTSASPSHAEQNWSLPQAVANLEKEMIIEAMKKHNGHQGRAARTVDVTERQMGYKIKKYDLIYISRA